MLQRNGLRLPRLREVWHLRPLSGVPRGLPMPMNAFELQRLGHDFASNWGL